MKKFVILSLLFVISCKEQEFKKIYEMEIKYYWDIKNPEYENIKVSEKLSNNNNLFIYDYVKLHNGIDTLIIKDNKVFLKNTNPKFISKKTFFINNKKIEIKKYFYTSGHPHSLMNFYINNEKGIIMSENGNGGNVEYSYKENSEIINQILIDKKFSLFELK